MNRTTLARRYAPLLAVAAIQLLIIATVPSRAPAGDDVLAVGPGVAPGAGVPGAVVPGAIDPATGQAIDPASGGAVDPATGQAAGSPGTVAGGGGASGGPAAAGGDTSHCRNGRQYDENVFFYAPPCAPKWSGDNGGATYQGVTKDAIKVIYYEGNYGEAVNAILDAQGSLTPASATNAFQEAAEAFINEHYELYGRKIDFELWQGRAQAVPPDCQGLRNEAKTIIQQKKPYAFIFPTTVASCMFDELSAQKVVNFGGYHFRDSFNKARRPYHWDIDMDGTRLVNHVAEWYCKRLHGKKARFAGATGTGAGQNPPNNDIRNKTRVLGVISTDDPENKGAIEEFKKALAKCGAKVEHEFFYAQDITRAEEQRRLGMARMRENPESTTIMCFCDTVAPMFLYQTAEEQRYYPEHVIVGSSGMDQDSAAQAYDNTLPPKGYQFENAFGLASRPQQENPAHDLASRVWRAAGRQGNAPHNTLVTQATYYLLLANLIQGAGPNLNPATMERGAQAVSVRGTSNHVLRNPRSLTVGDYTWNDAMREVYWSTQQKSEFNGKNGRWISLNNGQWFNPGQYPAGEPAIPDKPR